MFPILIHIGPVTLHTYGLLIAVAFLAALAVARREFDREGLPVTLVDRVSLVMIAAGILGARLLYFAVYGFRDLASDPWSFFRIWEGGLVFYGGFIAALAALMVLSARSKIPFLKMTDVFVAPLFLGQAIGRLGCFAAGCCYGKPTDSALSVVFTHPESLAPTFVPLHPTQIYSSLGHFLLFGGALWLGRTLPATGVLTAFYLLGYGSFRFLIEFLRGDDRGAFIGGLSPSQWIGILLIAAGTGLVFYVRSRRSVRN